MKKENLIKNYAILIRDKVDNFFVSSLIISLPFWNFRLFSLKIIELFMLFWVIISFYSFMLLKHKKMPKHFFYFLFAAFFYLAYYLYSIFYLHVNIDCLVGGEWSSGVHSVYTWNTCYLLQMLLILFYLYKMFDDRYSIKVNYNLFILIIIFEFLFCLIEYLSGSPRDQLCGTFSEKGPLSYFIAFSLILMMEKIGLGWRVLCINLLGLLFMLWINGTRGELILFLYLFILLFRNKYFIGKKYVFFAISLAFFISLFTGGILYIGNKIIAYFTIALDKQYELSAIGRYAALYLLPRVLSDHFSFGVGLGNYEFVRNFHNYIGNLPMIGFDYSNNLYIENLIEFGFIGTGVYFALFYLLLKKTNIGIKIVCCVAALCSIKNDYIYFIMLGLLLLSRETFFWKKHKISELKAEVL